jgi:hypothetical protein
MDLGVKKCHDQDDKILADDHVIMSPDSLIGDLEVKRHIYNEMLFNIYEMNIELNPASRRTSRISRRAQAMEFAAFHYSSEMDYSEHGLIGGMTVRCIH